MRPFSPSLPIASLAALVAGGVAALGFEPWNLWPLTLVGIAVLLALIDGTAGRGRAALYGWLFATAHFTAGLGWIATAFTFQSKMPAWLGWVTVVLLAMFLALYAGLAAGLTRALARSPLARVLVFAALWMLAEWLRGWVLTGFAWNPLGAAWLGAPGLVQLASLVGALGLSSLVVLGGGGLWLLLHEETRLTGAILATGILLGGLIGATMARDYRYPENPLVFLVQPDIGQDSKYATGAADAHFQTYLDLTASALAAAEAAVDGGIARAIEAAPATADFAQVETRPDPVTAVPAPDPSGPPVPKAAPASDDSISAQLAPTRPGAIILWSESAVPYAVEEEPQVRARMASVLGPNDLLLFGGVAAIRDAAGTVTALTNSLFVLDAKGRILGRYDKAHLVPLGEYVPARALMTALGVARLAPGDLDFRPGPGPQTLKLPGFAAVGVQICYEIIFPGRVIDAANRPSWIANISNDAWFGPSGPPQHLAQARLRAIEEGLPVARATPTGISAMIDAHGRVLASIPAGTQGVESAQLPPALPPTLFARLGHTIAAGLGLVLLGLGLLIDRRRA